MTPISFDELYNTHRQAIYNRILFMMRSPELTEEVCQETFLRAWLKLPSLEHSRNIGGWLYTIATRLCINILREAHHPTCSLDEALFLPSRFDTPDTYADRALYVLAWKRLNKHDQQIIVANLIHGEKPTNSVYMAKRNLMRQYKRIKRSYEVSA